MKKFNPGEFEYYNYKKTKTIILTVIEFAISIALYVVGYITTGSNKNLLTIIAVLGLLPASKSAVSMIMYLRYHGCTKELFEEFNPHVTDLLHSYGMVFTTYKKTYECALCIVKNSYVYVYLTNHQTEDQDLNKHLSDMIKQNGYSGFVGVFTKKDDFIKRIDELSKKDDDNTDLDQNLLMLMHQLSL